MITFNDISHIITPNTCLDDSIVFLKNNAVDLSYIEFMTGMIGARFGKKCQKAKVSSQREGNHCNLKKNECHKNALGTSVNRDLQSNWKNGTSSEWSSDGQIFYGTELYWNSKSRIRTTNRL